MQVEEWVTFCVLSTKKWRWLLAAAHSCAVILSHCQVCWIQADVSCCSGFQRYLPLFVLFLCPVTPERSLSAEHQLQQTANSQQSAALTWQNREKFRLPKRSLFCSLCVCACVCPCVCVDGYIWTKSCQQSAQIAAKTPWSVPALSHPDLHKHDGRLPGRFSLSQHHITPLIWSHFAWLHPDWLPVGAQRGKQLDRRSLLLIGWQDAGSVSHWVDPLSSCSCSCCHLCRSHWPLVPS